MRLIVLILIGSLALAGCAASPQSSATNSAAAISSSSIRTIDDGIGWAHGLTKDVTATELSAGIQKLGDLVPDQNIWFETKNDIGQKLISLNSAVLGDPGNAGTKVDDLIAIVDELVAATAKGNKP